MKTAIAFPDKVVALPSTKTFKFFILWLLLIIALVFSILQYYTIHQTNVVAQSQATHELYTQLNETVQGELADLQQKLSAEKYKKLLAEIAGILALKDYRPTELYTLRTRIAGYYPVIQSTAKGDEIIGEVFLYPNEIWKVGQTCCGEEIRYRGFNYFESIDGRTTLNNNLLRFNHELSGTRTDMLIAEKIWIYSYPFIPESIARVARGGKFLEKPAGNKIFK